MLTHRTVHPEPEPGQIAYPSDHTGVLLELDCERPHGVSPTGFPTTTSTVAPGPAKSAVDNSTLADVIDAFETALDGSDPDIDHRLASLEDADRRHDAFIILLERADPVAASTSVRVESVTPTATTAQVVFDVLLDDAVVFRRPHRFGAAAGRAMGDERHNVLRPREDPRARRPRMLTSREA